jgi:hypothetical protein
MHATTIIIKTTTVIEDAAHTALNEMLALNIVGLIITYVSLILTTPYEISENNI